MRFTPEFLDELRARLPVSEVVGKRVKLKKAGREWKGLSPFQQEKTPSFFVNDQKQAWFDFSSGLNGNIFDFLMKTEGVTLDITDGAIDALADVAVAVNSTVENIGARRLQTVMERVLDEISFTAPDRHGETIQVDADYVTKHVGDLAKNADLSRFIL